MFHIYELFLILSGAAMLVMARVKSGQATTRRVWNAVLGAAFTGYGAFQGPSPDYGQPSGYGQPAGVQPQGPVQ